MAAALDPPRERPAASAVAITASVGLFLLMGICMCIMEIPQGWAVPAWSATFLQGFMILVLLFPALGYAAGWMLGFPAWSYPYVGLHLLISLYMMMVATPGVKIFGYTFRSDEMWGWRAWIPFLVATLLALLVTRSFQPVARFFTQAWQDWTRLTYGMYGFMPLVIMISFDEINQLYSLYFMVILTLLMVCTSLLYILATRSKERAWFLVGGVLVTMAVTLGGSSGFWAAQSPAGVNIPQVILQTIVATGVLLSPALILVIQRWIQWITAPQRA